MPRGFAALIGVLAVGAALGVGHLVAGLISPASSPYLAVGDTVIRFSPEWLTEFAKSTFGTADKPVLLGGMAVVIALAAAAAGIASRRSPRPGVAVVVVLGVLGFLAVISAPVFAPLDLLAPAASLAAGVVTFRGLHGLALRTYGDRGAADRSPDPGAGGPSGPAVSRRGVLIGSSAAVGVGALAAGAGGFFLGRGVGDSRAQVTARLAALRGIERAPAIPAGAAYAAELGTTTFITPNPDFYRIDVALRIPTTSAADWSLRIHGMVDNEIVLSFEDLLRRPLFEKTITMTCVSNEVGGSLISTANFIGVSLRDLLLEAGVQPGADQVFTTSIDGWTAGTPADVIMRPDRDALLAFGMNGEALPPEHGFPVRMVVPGLYGFVSATKWIADMELTTFDRRRSYWLERGWAEKAPIKTQSRIDSPRGFATVPAGKVSIAGIAWSQPAGIGKVEVRMDGGPWQPAELATEVSGDTWRMWRTEFDLGPGSHTVQARATDAHGVTQTEMRAGPIPDGASGWPATIFTVI
ncbi:molybdopterin-dependent oxidoreductase [Pseudonocardia bannensis]|uniref:Molybdopterin-dependent oxidoreductase n=1 Tax=Pseudonocardia bannensis TaxID=630973 RepID=A0A848DM27_9PSEU|nr:molybdopterin-dependent oxidoreductase [Pseudonocardia bannensis]